MQAVTGIGEGRGVPDAPREALAEDLRQTLPVDVRLEWVDLPP